MEKKITEREGYTRAVMIIMRGIRAGLISPDEVLQMLLDDGRVDPLYDAGLIVVNRFIMTKITDEQERLFMDYRNIGQGDTREYDRDMAYRIENDPAYANIRDLIMDEADEEPDWPSL